MIQIQARTFAYALSKDTVHTKLDIKYFSVAMNVFMLRLKEFSLHL